MTNYRPLAGIRVVDLADEKAELGGRVLADLGADVVRIEPPGGSVSRQLPPLHGGSSLFFAVRNANKRSAVLDLTEPADRSRFLELLEAADIWIETTRPRSLAEVDLDPRTISEKLPHLVVVSVTDFGHTGPYRDYVATDPVMSALSWLLFRAGVPELPPVLPPGSLPYDMVGVSAALAGLTAYLDKCSTGRGQHIDMSVMEAVAQLTDWGLTSYSWISKFGMYGEIRDGGGKTYPIIPCQDGFVRPAMVTAGEWRKLRDWIGESGLSPDIVQADYWEQSGTRIELFDDLMRPIFVEFFSDKTMMDASIEGQKRGIPITPMLTPADAMRAEQFEVLGSFIDGDPGRLASGFLTVDGERIGYRRPAPALGSTSVDQLAWTRRDADPGDGRTEPGRPYKGLRVVEFGVAGAVPEIGRMLAEYGADVIRVENPKKPDLFRQLAGPAGMGSVFASSNRTTRSFGVDYSQPEGAELVKELIAAADMVFENLTVGALDEFGLGPEQIRAINPGALVLSTQTMGRRGPWSHWRGYGSNTQLPSGMSWLWSFPDVDEPVPQNVAFPDHFVGRLGATVVAADLIAARHGQHRAGWVEIVQAEMAVNLLADRYLQESLEPGSVQPLGNRSPLGAPWGVYQCAGNQRWVVITCRTDDQWHALVAAMGDPDWTAGLDDVTDRVAAQDDIDRHISAWTAERDDREVMALLQASGVPAGYMMYMSDQPKDPHFRERGYILEIDQPGLGDVLFEGPAFHATRLPEPITSPAPLLGEHTIDIWTELLGRPPGEAQALIEKGILFAESPPDSRP